MGASKSDIFSRHHNQIADMAKAMAHPARVAILEQILDSGSCICNDLVINIPLAQATISQHFKELKIAGIIKGQTEGKAVCYCIDEDNWNQMATVFSILFKSLKNKNCC